MLDDGLSSGVPGDASLTEDPSEELCAENGEFDAPEDAAGDAEVMTGDDSDGPLIITVEVKGELSKLDVPPRAVLRGNELEGDMLKAVEPRDEEIATLETGCGTAVDGLERGRDSVKLGFNMSISV